MGLILIRSKVPKAWVMENAFNVLSRSWCLVWYGRHREIYNRPGLLNQVCSSNHITWFRRPVWLNDLLDIFTIFGYDDNEQKHKRTFLKMPRNTGYLLTTSIMFLSPWMPSLPHPKSVYFTTLSDRVSLFFLLPHRSLLISHPHPLPVS